MDRTDEPGVSFPSFAALCNDDLLTGLRQIGYKPGSVRIEYLRSNGYLDDAVLAVPAVLVLAFAVNAVFCTVMPHIAEIDQGREPRRTADDDIAAVSSVTAVRASPRYILFPSEADASVSSITGLDLDLCSINEFHTLKPNKNPP